MFAKKLVIASFASLLAFASTVNWAYTEVACSTDSVFEENSCNQCFDGGTQSTGNNIGLLSDSWVNSWEKSLILYKDEQDEPTMVSLNWAMWNQTPDADGFWEYTEDMDALYSGEEGWYILWAWNTVTWLQSKLWYAYNLAENTAIEWENIWLLVYPIITHVVNTGWDIEINWDTHKECVLFKSAEAWEVTATPEKPKELPQTWPESILLLFLAMLLAFWVLKLTRKA